MQDQSALLNAMAVTECNLHVGAPQKPHLHGMAKPQFYDFVRKLKENKGILREHSKEAQIASGRFVSEDMLIRSSKEIIASILPYLKTIVGESNITELASFKQRYGGGASNLVGEDEARDNFFREQQMQDEYRQLNKGRMRHHGQAQPRTAMLFEARSHFKMEDLSVKKTVAELNESDLDMMLDELVEALNDEDIESD